MQRSEAEQEAVDGLKSGSNAGVDVDATEAGDPASAAAADASVAANSKARTAKTAEEEEEELRARYAAEGQQHHVTALLITHHHGHPHILLREDQNPEVGGWRLIGGKLAAGETDEAGLLRILRKQVSATEVDSLRVIQWDIVDLAAQWWRPDFSPSIYPYVPAHVSNAKESIKLYTVQLLRGASCG